MTKHAIIIKLLTSSCISGWSICCDEYQQCHWRIYFSVGTD